MVWAKLKQVGEADAFERDRDSAARRLSGAAPAKHCPVTAVGVQFF